MIFSIDIVQLTVEVTGYDTVSDTGSGIHYRHNQNRLILSKKTDALDHFQVHTCTCILT